MCGISNLQEFDANLLQRRKALVVASAQELDKCRMIRFEEKSGNFFATDLGRVASHFYVNHETVMSFNEMINSSMTEADILSMMAQVMC
jgi:activating signal cointegrator complex subunit 3